MTKHSLGLFLCILLLSCKNQNTDLDLCEKEFQLLKAEAPFNAKFYFSLTKEQVFDSLQKQIDSNLCNDLIPISCDFTLQNNQVINALLYVDWICPSHPLAAPASHFPQPTIQILINNNSQLLVDDAFVQHTKLDSTLYAKTSKEYYMNGGLVGAAWSMYDISWQDSTPLNIKVQVFEASLNAYLKHTNDISQKIFSKSICELDSSNQDSLRGFSKYVFFLRNLTPPPSDISIPFDSLAMEFDTIETELIEARF